MNPDQNQNQPTNQDNNPRQSTSEQTVDLAQSAEQPVDLKEAEKPSESRRKFVLSLTIVVVGLVILVVLGWLLYSNWFKTIPLKTYKGFGYTVLAPKDYQVKTNALSSVSFLDPKTDENNQSREVISIIEVPDFTNKRDKVIKEADSNLNKQFVAGFFNGDKKVNNFKVVYTTVNGQEARKVTASVADNGQKIASFYELVVFGEDNIYNLRIGAYGEDSGLNKAADDILSSFRAK